MDFVEFFRKTIDLITTLGVTKGLFVAFFFVAHIILFLQYRGRLKDRQKEIDRLAGENKEHRERFTALMDKQFKIPKSKVSPPGGRKKLRGGKK